MDSELLLSAHLLAFAEGDDASIKDAIKEVEKHRMGFEPLDVPLKDGTAPITDPRVK